MRNPAPTATVCRLWLGLGLAGLEMLALLAGGCAHPLGRRSPGRAVIHSTQLTNASGQPVSMEVLAVEVMRFADGYAMSVAQAVDDLLGKVTTPEARLEAVRWKLGQATAAFVDATGPNPALDALDLVVLASVSRMVMEDHYNRMFGPEGLPLLDRHRQLETNAWVSARRVLRPEQQQELKAMIREWRRQNPNQRYVAATRFRELGGVVEKAASSGTSRTGSLFSWLYLDPFAGLDPTAEAIQETRRLAERAMYYSQRMPALLNWQVQLLTMQLTSQPEAKQLLGNAESLTRSTDTFAQVAAQLPKLVNEQREAAIRQVFDGLAAERTNWLASLSANEQSARALLAETRQTLNAASDMAAGVHGAVKTLDEFVRYVSPPETNQAIAAPNEHPFNVLDFGTAATQIGRSANELNALLLTLNQSAPGLSRQMTADVSQLLHRTFLLGGALILILLVGLVCAGLAFQALRRMLSRERSPATPSSPRPPPGWDRSRIGPAELKPNHNT